MTPNLYDTLNVASDADPETIKKAYRKRAIETHPDKGGNKEEFQTVALAFSILSDKEKRERYDKTGKINGSAAFSQEAEEQILEGRAASVAISTVFRVYKEMTSRGQFHVDLFDTAKKALRMEIGQFKDAIRSERDEIREHEKFLKRVRLKKSSKRPPFVENAIREQIRLANERIEQLEGSIKIATKAIELLGDYEDAGIELAEMESSLTRSSRSTYAKMGYPGFGGIFDP